MMMRMRLETSIRSRGPRIDDVDAAALKAVRVTSGDGHSPVRGYRCNLSIETTYRPSHPAPARHDVSEGLCRLCIERQYAAGKLIKYSVSRLGLNFFFL